MNPSRGGFFVDQNGYAWYERRMKQAWDTIIIGGGAAAWSAGLYAARRQMTTLVIAKDIGGQALLTQHIENYPGINKRVTGADLIRDFWQQAEKHGAKTKIAEVVRVAKDGDVFVVETATGERERATTLILAFGLTPKNLDIPGEDTFRNKGVHYCATCDAPLYKGKTVAVVGGTNGAKDAALLLAKMCPKVYLIHHRDSLVGDVDLISLIGTSNVIEVVPNRSVVEVRGAQCVSSIVLDDKRAIAVDGVFVELGHIVKTDFVGDVVERNELKHIVVDKNMNTKTPGVFAAGDVTQGLYKQVVISAGEGAVAALEAYQYLQKKSGRPAIVVDWDR